MKDLSFFRCRAAAACLLAFLGAGSPAAADTTSASTTPSDPKAGIQQNQSDEQAIREHTSAVVVQIQGLIDELAANGISGGDSKVLQATKAALTHLSGSEIDRVLASLQKAGQAANTTDAQQNAISAYADQKGIILQFRQILKDYEERQAAYDLPVRFKELTDRQTQTMLTSEDVARATAGKSGNELSTLQQTTEQIAQADQEAITNEVALAQDQLKQAAQGATGDEAKGLQQAQQDMQNSKLSDALNQANDDLKGGHLLKAIAEQKAARDELRRINGDLDPPATALDALTTDAATLAKLIGEQKALLAQTQAAEGVQPRVVGLDSKQAALVDEATTLQQDTATLSGASADLVRSAIQPMQMSRFDLATPGRDSFSKSATSQEDVIAKLEAAQSQLQQQVADAQKAADDAAEDPVAKLEDLQKQIQTAQQQQQQVQNQTQQAANTASTPDATAMAQAQQEQAQLQQQTAAMQQSAQPLSLQATQALADAANQMNQAQQDLTDPAKTAAAEAAQQAAANDLAQAGAQVAQQVSQDQQQAQPADPSAMAAAAQALQQAQNSVSDAMAKTTPAGSGSTPPTPPAGAPGSTPPAPQLADAGKSLADAAKDTQAATSTPGLPDAAAQAVQAAQAAIDKGRQMASKNDAKAALAQEAAAQQALAQAQAAVAMAQAGMAAAAPTPPDAGNAGSPPPGPPDPNAPPSDAMSMGSTEKGTLHSASGKGKFVSLEARDRTAIDQTQGEKRPEEFGPMIDQYMKNLADQSSTAQ